MKVLIACEYSGVVRDCFDAMGHDATSCDILPSDAPLGKHYQGDVTDILDDGWDLMIAHPPCTYICSSGLHWNNKRPERAAQTTEALEFVELLWRCSIPKVAIENPVGCINTRLSFMPKPQYVHPYMFGEDASKKTGLWTRGLPQLVSSSSVEPRIVNGYNRWGNQRDCGRDDTPNTVNRAKIRSMTFFGIAYAMASQWG